MKKIKLLSGIISIIIFLILQIFFYGKYEFNDWRGMIVELLAMLFACFGAVCLLPAKRKCTQKITVRQPEGKSALKRTILAALMVIIAVPITIWVGIKFFGDRRYYLISLLIIFEIMLPFFISFERRRPKAKELVIISLFCAAAVVGRAVFFMLPQFKPIIAMVIIAGVCLGGETGFLVGAICAFVSNFYFGQGAWTPWQMFGFGIIGFLAGILFRKNLISVSKISLCIFGGLSTVLIYGGIQNPASLIMMGEAVNINSLIAIYASGLTFDLMHAAATVLFLWVISEPLIETVERVKVKFGLYED